MQKCVFFNKKTQQNNSNNKQFEQKNIQQIKSAIF